MQLNTEHNGDHVQYMLRSDARRECVKALSEVFLLTNPFKLKTLPRRGHLVLVDILLIICTNELKWELYLLLVRNECVVWCPAAHLLTEKGGRYTR